MIESNVLIVLLVYDRKNCYFKGIFFTPRPNQSVEVYVFYDADNLTQLMSLIIGVFCFVLNNFRCRSPPTFNFKNKKIEWRKYKWTKDQKEESIEIIPMCY